MTILVFLGFVLELFSNKIVKITLFPEVRMVTSNAYHLSTCVDLMSYQCHKRDI